MKIRKIEDITIDWLKEVIFGISLASAPLIRSFRTERVGVDKGFVNQLARVVINYEPDIVGPPSSVIVKCPPLDEKLRSVSDRLKNVLREITVYKEFDSSSGITIPKLYYSSLDESSGNGVLVIEDIGYAAQGDSVQGCSYQEAVLAVTSIAKFHAYYWISSNRYRFALIPEKRHETAAYEELFKDAWLSLIQQAGRYMPLHLVALGDKLAANIDKVKSVLSSKPITLIHGDYRLDNCFFIYDGELQPIEINVIDWEYSVKSRGTYDIAAFITEAFNPTYRRDVEEQLLGLYYSTLKDNGVTDYSLEECYSDYSISMLEILIFWVISGGFCDYSGSRATEYLINSLERLSEAITDWNCEEFLT